MEPEPTHDPESAPEALAPTIAAPPPTTPRPGAASDDGSTPRAPAAHPEDALAPGEILGERYRIVAMVGRGGQGDVYRAEDLEVEGHVVALKLLHHGARSEAERASATRELRMLAAVSHPSIVQFKDSGWYGARLWFVMPWLDGRTLEQLGRISRAEARRIFESIAAGVAALHAKGMRHQDIKPSNVFLARVDGFEESMPVLLDLGVAAQGDDAPVAGSPDYFAPELAASWAEGGGEVGPAADVYALALSLRNALDPETAPSVDVFSREDLERRAKEPVAPPSGREFAHLRGAFERWLAIDPSRRPSADALMRELAILTAPEDRRRERARIARRVAPWAGLLAVLIGVSAWWANGELLAREKAAARAAEEQRVAEARAAVASEEARAARDSEREALARAESSAEEADRREEQARDALARVRTAQRALGRAEGDRARLAQAIEDLQAALAAAEHARASELRAREAERSAREAERAESERALRGARDAHERDRRDLTEQRDRALVAIGEAEARARQAEASASEATARAAAAEERARAADARATQLERRVAELEARARRAPTAPTSPVVVVPPPQAPATDSPVVVIPPPQ